MRGDDDPFARLHADWLIVVVEQKVCGAAQDGAELGLFLIVPLVGSVPLGNDSFDDDIITLGKDFQGLLSSLGCIRQVGKEIGENGPWP